MGLRVSTTRLYAATNQRLLENLQKLYKAQEGLATGKKIRSPQDNPAAFSRIVSYKGVKKALNQYERNISFAQGYMDEAETALGSVSNLLARAKELAMKGSSGGNSPEGLSAMGVEADALYEQVLALANSQWTGGGSQGARYIFSGYRTDTEAFLSDGTYQGDGGEYRVEVGPDEYVAVGLAGDRVFQGDVDVFAVLRELRDRLQAQDPDGAAATLNDLDTAMEQITGVTAEIGSRTNRLEQTETRLQDLVLSVESFISQEEDLDLVQAASDLTLYQSVLQATIRSSQMIFETLNFL